LHNQNAFITGGGSGIGLACANALVRDGASVTLFGRDAGKLERAAAHVVQTCPGARVSVCPGDVRDENAVAAGITACLRAGPITIAIANAGTGAIAPLLSMDLSQWDSVLRTNLRGTVNTFTLAGRAIANGGGGSMCAISSIAGVRTHRFMSAYCVSKAAIDNLVQNAADELGAVGVRVNSVLPGLVDTDIAAGLFATKSVYADYLACMPLGRTGTVADIAAAVRFLCGPESSWITGVNLSVDGGHHLRRGPSYDAFAQALFADDPAARATIEQRNEDLQ
jgi:NAD(P)-dependent dehydrogenase (short-subunit alcohol dehydrogenase family)